MWVVDKHEFEDHLPGIYEAAMGEPYPGGPLDEHLPLGPDMIEALLEVVGEDRLHFELVRELLDVEQRHRAQVRRAGLFESLEKALRRGFYDDEEDATMRAHQRKAAIDRTPPDDRGWIPGPARPGRRLRPRDGGVGPVILNQLVLHNVGTFAGRHVIDLTPPSASRPIVLVGGLNGAGKTTILESIQLALYGSLAHASGRRNGSYDNYLRGLIHRGVPASEGAAIELTFTAHQEGMEHKYWIRRSWKGTGASIREILLVSVDDRHNQALTSTWSEHVETFLPRGIAGLFFFDGEQIEALADLERSRQVLSSALAALLGLDLVERLTTDLAVLKRRHRGEQVPDSLRQAVEEKKQLVTAHRQGEEAATEAEAARRTELERCAEALPRGDGGVPSGRWGPAGAA